MRLPLIQLKLNTAPHSMRHEVERMVIQKRFENVPLKPPFFYHLDFFSFCSVIASLTSSALNIKGGDGTEHRPKSWKLR